MAVPETIDYETVLQLVRSWPSERRVSLLQDILKTLALPDAPPRQHSGTLDQALGLLANEDPPPSDEEIARWLDERRQERYGV